MEGLMKLTKTRATGCAILSAAAVLFTGCFLTDALDDAQKTKALEKVTITFDSVDVELDLPAGVTSGKTFDQLMAEDPTTYGNPENYAANFTVMVTADNTADDAEDVRGTDSFLRKIPWD